MRGISLFALVVAMSAPALAADIAPSRRHAPMDLPPAPVVQTVSEFAWTGLYLGVHGGWSDWALGRPDDASSPTQEIEGVFGGGQIGFDVQLPGNIVAGVVADASIGDLQGDTYKDGGTITVDSNIDAFGTLRGRLGYAIDGRILPYVTGGAAWMIGDTSEHCPKNYGYSNHCKNAGQYDETDDFSRWGWAYGAGVEVRVVDNLTVFAEYLRLDFDTETHDLGPKSSDRKVSIDEIDLFKAGVNYRFGGRLTPLN